MNDNILRDLEVEPTGVQFPHVHTGATVLQMTQECTDIEPMGLGMKSEYRLKCDIGVNFVCNEAQLDEARGRARQQLQRIIFYPVVKYADKAMMHLIAGDEVEARRAISAIIGIATGVTRGY